MQTAKNGAHITDSLFALAFELIAPDYLDRYQPAHCRPVREVESDLDTTQELQAVAS